MKILMMEFNWDIIANIVQNDILFDQIISAHWVWIVDSLS